MKPVVRYILLSLLCIAFGWLVSEKIDLSRDDIGRHIATGRQVIEQGVVPMTNYYSYTEPTRRAINHHWGSGTVFYLVWKAAGFEGLSLLHIVLRVGALIVVFAVASRKVGWGAASLVTLLAMPLLIRRREIRPEAFTYLLAGMLVSLMETKAVGRRFGLLLAGVAAIAVVWVNTHIQFVLGIFIIAAYLLGDIAVWKYAGRRLFLLGAFCCAALINPGGLRGVLLPFVILRAYPVPVGENQHLILMQRLFGGPEYVWFEVIVAALVVLVALLLVKRRPFAAWIPYAVIGGGFAAFGFFMIRSMVPFAYLFVPVTAGLLHALFGGKPPMKLSRAFGIAAAIAVVAALPLLRTPYSPVSPSPGLGLMPGVNDASAFLRRERIAGPIFNNYDIGGYLIFHLFPDQRVFVDNRPEAYSPAFWQQLYFPMLRSADVWNSADAHYRFNAAVVSPYGLSVSDRVFVARLNRDPAWALVYLDWYAAVFLRRNDTNAAVIARHEVPGKSVYDGAGK